MIEAVVFDMDGLLIDSEPLWAQAEIDVFAGVGIALDADRCRETVGLGLEEVVALRYSERPWAEPSRAEVAQRIHARVAELIAERGRAMPGAEQALRFVRGRGVRIGLATASDRELIQAALGRLELTQAFDAVQSAAGLERSKPHPEVYLLAAAALGVAPERCLAVEDSIPGLIAAKAAGMLALAVPAVEAAADPRFAIADDRLHSLEELDDDHWRRLEAMACRPVAQPG